jgi:hypothetical protein
LNVHRETDDDILEARILVEVARELIMRYQAQRSDKVAIIRIGGIIIVLIHKKEYI